MAEWPKTIRADGPDGRVDHFYADTDLMECEVIPVDLGRELYEVLKNETVECEANGIQPTADAHRVLARYEEEVDRG